MPVSTVILLTSFVCCGFFLIHVLKLKSISMSKKIIDKSRRVREKKSEFDIVQDELVQLLEQERTLEREIVMLKNPQIKDLESRIDILKYCGIYVSKFGDDTCIVELTIEDKKFDIFKYYVNVHKNKDKNKFEWRKYVIPYGINMEEILKNFTLEKFDDVVNFVKFLYKCCQAYHLRLNQYNEAQALLKELNEDSHVKIEKSHNSRYVCISSTSKKRVLEKPSDIHLVYKIDGILPYKVTLGNKEEEVSIDDDLCSFFTVSLSDAVMDCLVKREDTSEDEPESNEKRNVGRKRNVSNSEEGKENYQRLPSVDTSRGKQSKMHPSLGTCTSSSAQSSASSSSSEKEQFPVYGRSRSHPSKQPIGHQTTLNSFGIQSHSSVQELDPRPGPSGNVARRSRPYLKRQ